MLQALQVGNRMEPGGEAVMSEFYAYDNHHRDRARDLNRNDESPRITSDY
jgi:hypothetical protein